LYFSSVSTSLTASVSFYLSFLTLSLSFALFVVFPLQLLSVFLCLVVFLWGFISILFSSPFQVDFLLSS
jgi:hypothetical protein